MKYCTFRYIFKYEDGEIVDGWVPYKGESTEKICLREFVRKFFVQARPCLAIGIIDVFHISSEAIWMRHVSDSNEYEYLLLSNAF